MVPPIAAARAKKSGRLGAAFGPRFFLFLLLGLVWLGPAWWDARFLAGMLLWDALGIIFLAADLAALPRVEQIEVSRIWSSAPSLSVPARVAIEVRQQGKATIRAELADDVPASLCEKPPLLILRCAPGRPVRAAYDILPVERGDLRLGRISLRVQSPLGLAERWLVADVAQTVRVFPDLAEARRHTLYLMKSRQVELEKRRTRLRGYGREFESLREYREGDELRDICWTASARRGAPVTKTYEIERSQAVWLVVDAGRLLRARVGVPGLRAPLEKLDFSTSAALALAFVALYSGDRVGLVAYGRRVQQRLNAARGSGQQRALADALAQVRSEPWEGDHGLACDTLLRHQKRRSLVVWLTDLAETAAMPDVIESTMRLVRRHLVLFVVLGQPDLAQLAATTPRSPTEMYRSMAAQEMVQRRDLLLRDLHEQGAQTLQVDPQRLVPALLDAYLGIKERSLL
ncbi:MAG TPA: DUF58 domain-containing protein [Candidatus Acidoferrales bacterium]|nr:DUF58 domain-containing protein [Candidatus Acidoferrales bacterium]